MPKSIQLPSGKFLDIPDNSTPEQTQQFYDQAVGQAVVGTGPKLPRPDPGFWGEAYNHYIQPAVDAYSALTKSGGEAIGQAKTNPASLLTLGPKALIGLGKGVINAGVGNVKSQFNQAQEAWKAMTGQGDYSQMGVGGRISETLGHGLAAALPILGPQAAEAGENFGAGRIGQGAFDTVDILGQLLAPELRQKIVSGKKAIAPNIGVDVYKGAAKFPESMSLEDMETAAKLGLKEKLPIHSKAALAKLGSIDDPATVLGGLEKDVQSKIGAKAQIPLDWKEVAQPLLDEIGRVADDKTSSGRKLHSALVEELQTFVKNHSVVDPQTGKIMRVLPITVDAAQTEKRAIYRNISQAVYSDTATDLPSSSKLANKRLAQGLKNGINQIVPEVAESNDKMHSAIELHDAMTAALKKNPVKFADWVPLGLGIAANNYGPALGHPMAGNVFLTGLAIRTAFQDPVMASRLAIAAHNAGEGKIAELLSQLPKASGVYQSQQPPNH